MPYQNYRLAPNIKWIGDKFNYQGTYNKIKEKGYRFYQIPIKLLSYLYNLIPGKNGNIIKLVTLLVGSGETLGLSEKLIEERTGLSHSAYCAARKAILNDEILKKYFIYDSEQKLMIINYDNIWQDQREQEEKNLVEVADNYMRLSHSFRLDAIEYEQMAQELRQYKSEYKRDLDDYEND